MKKIHFIAVLILVAGSLIFSSCSQKETDPSPNVNGPTRNEAFLKNPPKRDMANITGRLKDLSSKGRTGARTSLTGVPQYYSSERWDATNTVFEGSRDFFYDGGNKLTDVYWWNGFYAADTYFTYDDAGKVIYQDEYDIDVYGNWRWIDYYYYQYNADNTLAYVINYNLDGSIFRFLAFTYRPFIPGFKAIDKVYQYDYDWDHLTSIHTYKYNLTTRITSIATEYVGVVSVKSSLDTYTYNANGKMASRTIYNNSRQINYIYERPDYWRTEEYNDGRLGNNYRYYLAPGTTGNFEPSDPKNIINLNSIDAFEF